MNGVSCNTRSGHVSSWRLFRRKATEGARGDSGCRWISSGATSSAPARAGARQWGAALDGRFGLAACGATAARETPRNAGPGPLSRSGTVVCPLRIRTSPTTRPGRRRRLARLRPASASTPDPGFRPVPPARPCAAPLHGGADGEGQCEGRARARVCPARSWRRVSERTGPEETSPGALKRLQPLRLARALRARRASTPWLARKSRIAARIRASTSPCASPADFKAAFVTSSE